MIVFDASALLAFLENEPGWETVKSLLPDAIMSTLNLAEALSKLTERGADPVAILHTLVASPLGFADLTVAHALTAAKFRPLTRAHGLSLGDRVCLALALELGCKVLTADRSWKNISVGVAVQMLR